MNSIETIETARLLGRPLALDDFDLLRQLHQNPQVTVTLGGMRGDEEVQQILNRYVDQWNQHGFGLWAWHARTDGRYIGRGGLHKVFVGGNDEVEVGYALLPEFWGQGFATEIAAASVKVAFEQLGLQELVSFTLLTNKASRHVMEKCGFAYERDIVYKDLPHVLYRLKRNWRRQEN